MSEQPPLDEDAFEYLYELYHKNLPPLAAGATLAAEWGAGAESKGSRSGSTAGKQYRRAESVPLAETERTELLARLRQRASYTDPTERRPITDTELATLLTDAYGETGDEGDAVGRPVPSAGACYPLELYPIVLDSPEVDPGLYHFSVGDDALDQLQEGDYTEWVRDNWTWVGDSDAVAAVVVITAVPSRAADRYGEMGYLFAAVEAGSVIQNLQLVAADLGIGSRPHNGVDYSALREELRLRNDEYLLSTVVFAGTGPGDPE